MPGLCGSVSGPPALPSALLTQGADPCPAPSSARADSTAAPLSDPSDRLLLFPHVPRSGVNGRADSLGEVLAHSRDKGKLRVRRESPSACQGAQCGAPGTPCGRWGPRGQGERPTLLPSDPRASQQIEGAGEHSALF